MLGAEPPSSRKIRLRVREVEHPRVGAPLLHVGRDPGEHRDVPQGPEDPTGPDGVADRLADPVPGRDLEVVTHALEAADREGCDDILGAVEAVRTYEERIGWRG